MKILITGATGFVGSELARSLLLENAVERLYLMIRPSHGESAQARFGKLVDYWGKFATAPSAVALEKVEIIEHDLEGSVPFTWNGQVDYVIHSAATTDLREKLSLCRRANLRSTQRLLAWSQRVRGLKRFVHLSTAYVSGKSTGIIRERDAAPRAYYNGYEQSKREAEDAVRNAGLPFVILRPSIIVGRSDDGYVFRLKVVYSSWRMWLAGVMPRAPLDPKSWVDLIPIDYVVAATLNLMEKPEAEGATLHLCAGDDRQSPKTVMLAATKAFGVAVPPISPPWIAEALRRPPWRWLIKHSLREMLDSMHHHLPYMGKRGRMFDMTTTDALLFGSGIVRPRFAHYGVIMFRYCKETSWGKKPRAAKPDAGKELACSA